MPYLLHRYDIHVIPNKRKVSLLCSFDVNVTPDKRKVFLHHEDKMLQTLQEVRILHACHVGRWFSCKVKECYRTFLSVCSCHLCAKSMLFLSALFLLSVSFRSDHGDLCWMLHSRRLWFAKLAGLGTMWHCGSGVPWMLSVHHCMCCFTSFCLLSFPGPMLSFFWLSTIPLTSSLVHWLIHSLTHSFFHS